MNDTCRIFDWENSTPEIDGQKEKLFLAFKAGSAGVLVEPDDSYKLSEKA
jgi:hypothetical protein